MKFETEASALTVIFLLLLLVADSAFAQRAALLEHGALPGPLPAELDNAGGAEMAERSRRALRAALRARRLHFQDAKSSRFPQGDVPELASGAAGVNATTGSSAGSRGRSVQSIGGTLDEPTGTVTLPVDDSQSCPGFYILRTHPGIGSQSGRVGAEILLGGTGLRTLQGGLNFGGQATSSIRGFSAFSIANAGQEDQVVNIGLDAQRAGRLTLERRSSGESETYLDQNVAAGEVELSVEVPPGFYVVGYRPDSAQITDYSIAALTSYVDRPGGGFQGGVVFGGYHNPSRESTGFGGFCIAESFDVSVNVQSQPTYGTSGAQGLAFSVASGNGDVYLDSRINDSSVEVRRPALVEAVAVDTDSASMSWLPARAPGVSAQVIEYRLHGASQSGLVPRSETELLRVTGQTSAELSGLQPGSERYVKVEAWHEGESLGWSNELLLAIPSIQPVVRSDRVIWVLDTSTVDDLEVEATTLSYVPLDESLAPEPGHLVVSALGDGLARSVVSVGNDQDRVELQTETEPAPLAELFEQAHVRGSFSFVDIDGSEGGDGVNVRTMSRSPNGRPVREAKWQNSGMTLIQEGAQHHSIDMVLLSRHSENLKSAGVVPVSRQESSQGEVEARTYFNAVVIESPAWVSATPGEDLTLPVLVRSISQDYELTALNLNAVVPPGERQAVPAGSELLTQEPDEYKADITVSPQRDHADDMGRPHLLQFEAVAEQVANCPVWGCATREIEFAVEAYVAAQLDGVGVDWDIGAPGNPVRLQGDLSIELEPEVRMEILREGFDVDYALFEVVARPARFSLSGRLNAAASGQYQGQLTDIVRKRFWKVIPAGSVPVLVSGTLSLDAELTLDASAQMDLEHRLDVEYELSKGVEYVRGEGYRLISPAVESEESYELLGEAEGQAGLDMRLIPRLDIGIYEIAFGRSKIEPFLAANTTLEGSFVRSETGSFDDANFRFTELSAGVGMDVGLRLDAGIGDLTLAGWPSIEADDFWTTSLIPEYKLVDLPQILLDVDEQARMPGRPNARLVSAEVIDTSPLHPWVPDSADWRVVQGGSPALIPDSEAPRTSLWIEPAGTPQDYKLRFSGHGRLGSYIRQSEDITLSSDLWGGGAASPQPMRLNDTGVDWCANADQNGLGCPVPLFPGQDGDRGRDALARSGQLEKAGDGPAGFDLTKLDASGNSLPASAATWSCVLDNRTGLIWEVKRASGLQSRDAVYSWLSEDGVYGVEDGGSCNAADCDTRSYAAAINEVALCGASSWRVPSISALRTIVDHSRQDPALASQFFPNASPGPVWSSDRFPGAVTQARDFYFNRGLGFSADFSESRHVRLVSGAWSSSAGNAASDESGHCQLDIAASTPESHFDLLGETVRHLPSGLEWRRCPEGMNWTGDQCAGSGLMFTWQEALEYAETQDQWRLPNLSELESLIERCRIGPSLNTELLGAGSGEWYLSSTPFLPEPDFARAVNFSDGIDGAVSKSGEYLIRLVRGEQVDLPEASFSLLVESTGAPAVSIAADPSSYGGITTYQVDDIPAATIIELTAPASEDSSSYEGWVGCDSVAGRTCTVNMNTDRTVTVEYASSDPDPEPDPGPAPSAASGRLNDTGVVDCADWTEYSLPCPVGDFPDQDAEVGRDALALSGSLEKVGAGHAGFDFSKLDSSGALLPASATSWSCVRDNHTGLVWEVKSSDPESVRFSGHYFSWYSPDMASNGGDSGQQDGTPSCSGGIDCDTYSYVGAVNDSGLCGIAQWRLPRVGELRSIVNFGAIDPVIDPEFFPEEYVDDQNNRYWTSQTNAEYPDDAWKVEFGWGFTASSSKSSSGRVRLVAGQPATPTGADSIPQPQCDQDGVPRSASSERYEILEGGAVARDTVTGLEWKRCAAGQEWDGSQCAGEAEWFEWREGLQLAAAEPGGWRLPNINELESLVEYCRVEPAINTAAFPATPSEPFFSSTPRNKGTGVGGQAWGVWFDEGNSSVGQMVLSAKIRLVRDSSE